MYAEIAGGILAGGMGGLALMFAAVKISESVRWTRAHDAYARRRAAPYLAAIERERRASAIAGAPNCEDPNCDLDT
jgi:hypothetical protein